MRYITFLYMGFICMTKSIFYGGSCDFLRFVVQADSNTRDLHVTCPMWHVNHSVPITSLALMRKATHMQTFQTRYTGSWGEIKPADSSNFPTASAPKHKVKCYFTQIARVWKISRLFFLALCCMDDRRQCGKDTRQARTTKWVLITVQHFMCSPKWKQKAGHHALVIEAIGHIINKRRGVFKVKHSSPSVVWTCQPQVLRHSCILLKSKQNSSHQMGALQTETTSILKKKNSVIGNLVS